MEKTLLTLRNFPVSKRETSLRRVII